MAAWSGGGSTKPPMPMNYIDSHGLNAGLGNSAHTQFPSVVDTKPMQVEGMLAIFKKVMKHCFALGGTHGELHSVLAGGLVLVQHEPLQQRR